MNPRLHMSRRARLGLLHDTVMAALAALLALYSRLGDSLWTERDAEFIATSLLSFAAVSAVCFVLTGSHRTNWRYVSLLDVMTVGRATALAVVAYLPVTFIVTRLEGLPRSFPLLVGVVLFALLIGPRILYRLSKEGYFNLAANPGAEDATPVLLYGATDGADIFLRTLARTPAAPFAVLGIIDERRELVGTLMSRVPVLGDIQKLPKIMQRFERIERVPQKLIVTDPTVTPQRLRELVAMAERNGLSLGRLTSPTEVASAVRGRDSIAPIAIEDLLGRPQAVLDRRPVQALITGRRVLVTGAGGSIGSEIARQVAALGPARLVLLDSSEYGLYRIDLDLKERWPALDRLALIGDVRDRAMLARLFAAERPEIVFHAAALKHVPVVETQPAEGAATNALGTRNVADACRAAGALAMVLISTDKAVNPTNAMGATKRLAEAYAQALDHAGREAGETTRFVTVRFGNVLGSTGSVVPLFQRQLAAGGPLTVTDPDITRYFMTIAEAVELVLQASAAGVAGDLGAGRIFVLDMGEPVRIADLARQMIRLAGLRPDIDIPIVFTGLRPGEKLHEELLHAAETLEPTPIPGIMLASPRIPHRDRLAKVFDRLAECCAAGDDAAVVALLRQSIPEYIPAPNSAHATEARPLPRPVAGDDAA